METMTATFTILPEKETPLLHRLQKMLDEISTQEPGTCLYLATTEEQKNGPTLLTTVESYADEAAFNKHTETGSPWDTFRLDAISQGWLVTDTNNPTGLKSTFAKLSLHGSILRSTLG